MAVTVNGTASSTPASATASTVDNSTLTIASGSNTVLLAAVSVGTLIDTSLAGGATMVWDQGGSNQSMTFIGRSLVSTGGGIAFYGRINPTVGVGLTCRFSTGIGALNLLLYCLAYDGADQTSVAVAFPNFIDAASASTGVGVANVTVADTSADNYVFAAGNTSNTLSNPNRTSLVLNNSGTLGLNCQHTAGTGSSMLMSWDTNATWSVGGLSIKAVGAGGPAVTLMGAICL